jgi:hypothetical protein
MINAKALIGTHDVLFITFDSLRFDVAQSALERGLTPNLARAHARKFYVCGASSVFCWIFTDTSCARETCTVVRGKI